MPTYRCQSTDCVKFAVWKKIDGAKEESLCVAHASMKWGKGFRAKPGTVYVGPLDKEEERQQVEPHVTKIEAVARTRKAASTDERPPGGKEADSRLARDEVAAWTALRVKIDRLETENASLVRKLAKAQQVETSLRARIADLEGLDDDDLDRAASLLDDSV